MSDLSSDENQVRKAVLNHLAQYMSTPALADAEGGVPLSDCGLDSFGSFEFILSLESRFGVTIGDQHLNARRLRSVNGIVELLLEIEERDGAR